MPEVGPSLAGRSHGGGASATLLFAPAALCFGTFALAAHAGLFVKSPFLHLLEHSLFCQLALEYPHRLIEGAFNSYFHNPPLSASFRLTRIGPDPMGVNRRSRSPHRQFRFCRSNPSSDAQN